MIEDAIYYMLNCMGHVAYSNNKILARAKMTINRNSHLRKKKGQEKKALGGKTG